MSQFINPAGELRYVSAFCKKGGPLQPDRTASCGRETVSVHMSGEGGPFFDGVGRAGVNNLAQKTGPEQCGCLHVLTPIVSEHLRQGKDCIHEAGYFAAAPLRLAAIPVPRLTGGGTRFAEISAGGCLNALPSSASTVTMGSRSCFASVFSPSLYPGPAEPEVFELSVSLSTFRIHSSGERFPDALRKEDFYGSGSRNMTL